jgi:hypothetical protein
MGIDLLFQYKIKDKKLIYINDSSKNQVTAMKSSAMTVPELEALQIPIIIGSINRSKKQQTINIHKCSRLRNNFTKM